MERKVQVFLSYAREDSQAASKIYNALKHLEIEIWMDKVSISPGERWKSTIKNAIRNSRYFIALLSKNSVSKKGFVQKELKIALEVLDEYPNNEIFVIPLRLDDCAPSYEKLYELNWVDLFPSWDEGIKKVILFLSPNKEDNDISNININNKLEIITKLCDIDFLNRITNKFKERNEIRLYLKNYLMMIPNNLKREILKLKNIEENIDDFVTCLELYFQLNCGKLDKSTICHICNQKGTIVHGTIDSGGGSLMDYNDNYIILCMNCFWSYYEFEIDYHGTGPLKFNYDKNIYE